jgi:hypothetical protein
VPATADRFGAIVPVRDAEALATAIENLLADPESGMKKARDAAAVIQELADGPAQALTLYATLLVDHGLHP